MAITPEDIHPWIIRLKELMAAEGITVQEAHDQEFAKHPRKGVTLDLAKQAILQEETARGSQPTN